MSNERFGRFRVSPAGPFEAGSHATLVFTYTVGEAGLRRGGRLRIATPNMGWGEPLVLCPNPLGELVRGPRRTHNPWKRLNTTFRVRTSTSAWVRMWAEERWCHPAAVADRPGWEWVCRAHQWRWWINADVEVEDFQPGDEIEITYGDTEEDPFGVRVQPFPESPARPFVCVVDVDGDEELREVAGSPVYPIVVSGPPQVVTAVVPSLARPGEGVVLRASVLDRNLTHPEPRYEGPAAAVVEGPFEARGDAVGRDGDAWVFPGLRAAAEGVARARVRTSVGEGVSNPALVTAEETDHLYWGDLHAQCTYHQWNPREGRGDSTRTPAELYQYARECSLLDFTAMANSGCPSPANPGWQESQQATIDFHQPGRFVTFKAWECGMGVQGDRCLIYRDADIEPNFPIPRRDEHAPTNAHALLRFCRECGHRIITSNHSFMKYMDWSVFDPEIDRIVEVYSCWGSYESREDNPLNSKRRPRRQSLMYMLGLGYTPGIVAAGDSHVGYPGRSLMYGDPYWCQNWKAGLAAVYAPALTREAIWDALYHRACYGTTGARIVLRFHLNGARMGSVLEYPAADERLRRRRLAVSVCGTELIRRVDILHNNAVLTSMTPRDDRVTFVHEHATPAPPTTRDWYYVRVFQADGNAAWSSPIWIGPSGVTAPSPSLGE
ncbi:MAG: DUF3604 domain-containing protein [Lentisphaeria bacterium]|nr:DUF3604 domain-containing protein [Lentisphaeria bacterium]